LRTTPTFDGVRCMMEMLRALYVACRSLVACCAAWQGLIRDDSLGMAEVDLARYGTGPADQGTPRRAAVLCRPAPSVLSGSKPLRIRPKRTPARQDRESPELMSSRVCLVSKSHGTLWMERCRLRLPAVPRVRCGAARQWARGRCFGSIGRGVLSGWRTDGVQCQTHRFVHTHGESTDTWAYLTTPDQLSTRCASCRERERERVCV
jgi:hypothetical protein